MEFDCRKTTQVTATLEVKHESKIQANQADLVLEEGVRMSMIAELRFFPV
jgi:hypothetical protein